MTSPQQPSGSGSGAGPSEPVADAAPSQSSTAYDDGGDDRRVLRRQQILQTAKEVFAERGYHNASINEIITRANIARGTFYLYFSNKHKVFDSILGEALTGLRDRITRIEIDDPDAPSPQEQLRQNLVRVLAFLLGDQPLTRLVLNHSQHPQTEVAERVDAFLVGVIDLIEASLTRGVHMGLVRPCDARLIAAALLGAFQGMISDCLRAATPPDVDTVADQMLAFAMFGVFQGR